MGKAEGADRTRWLDGIPDSMDLSLSKLWELVKARGAGMLQSMGPQRVGHDLVTEKQNFFLKNKPVYFQWKF